MSPEIRDLVENCRRRLDLVWQETLLSFSSGDAPRPPLGAEHELTELIRACLTSKIKSYHYVLPTQLLAKAVSPDLDAHSLMAAYEYAGSFDARTIAHEVIVPFDQGNYGVLGGSPEPYVNNPLRVRAVTSEFREQQKNKADWDKLITVLDWVEASQDPDSAMLLLRQVLFEIHLLLSEVQITYPTPNRASLKGLQDCLSQYLAESSGGERLEVVATALFRVIGSEFGLFDDVKHARVNAADRASGMLADIECWHGDEIVLLVEVKDRVLTLTHLDSKLESIRSRRISEVLFLARWPSPTSEQEILSQRIAGEFSSGHNIYIADFASFSSGILALLGEQGRSKYLAAIGQELERSQAGIVHRRAWAKLLKFI